jgi:hypothetical protein
MALWLILVLAIYFGINLIIALIVMGILAGMRYPFWQVAKAFFGCLFIGLPLVIIGNKGLIRT